MQNVTTEDWLRNMESAPPTDECVLWPFSVGGPGYGQAWVNKKVVTAHRHMCEAAHGPAPEGTEAAHLCGVRRCVNPKHLRWATRRENQADKATHGTLRYGERHQNAKLTEKQARAIFHDTRTHQEIADDYGVGRRTVGRIKDGTRWTRLGEKR